MKKSTSVIITIVGLIMAAAGLWYAKSYPDAQGLMQVLAYIFVGVGCGAFGHGAGEIMSAQAMKSSPEIQKQLDIDKNDERNVQIANKAKAKAYDAMIYVFGAIILCVALTGAQMEVVLLLVFAYLLVVGISIYYRCKYDKKM